MLCSLVYSGIENHNPRMAQMFVPWKQLFLIELREMEHICSNYIYIYINTFFLAHQIPAANNCALSVQAAPSPITFLFVLWIVTVRLSMVITSLKSDVVPYVPPDHCYLNWSWCLLSWFPSGLENNWSVLVIISLVKLAMLYFDSFKSRLYLVIDFFFSRMFSEISNYAVISLVFSFIYVKNIYTIK